MRALAKGPPVPGFVALGVGSIVGAGIFALMGEAAAMAGSAVGSPSDAMRAAGAAGPVGSLASRDA